MSEYINRDDALNCFHDWVDKHGDVVCADDMAEYIEIESLPSIELVRCKDCKHWYPDADAGMACEFTNMGQPEDGFCNWAEQKEGDEE